MDAAEFSKKLNEIVDKHAADLEELVNSARCAANVLFLLDEHVKSLGLNANAVAPNLKAAISKFRQG